jgi:hypothetical protein
MTKLIYDYGSPENNAAVLRALDNLPPVIGDHIHEEVLHLYLEGYAAAKAFDVKLTFVPEPEDSPDAGRFRIHLETPGDEPTPTALLEMLHGMNEPRENEEEGFNSYPLFGKKFQNFSIGLMEGRINQDHDFHGAVRAFYRPQIIKALIAHLDDFKFTLIDNDNHDPGFFNWAKKLDRGISLTYKLDARVWGPIENGRQKPGELLPVCDKVREIANGIRRRYATLILVDSDVPYEWLPDHTWETLWDLTRCYANAVNWINHTVDGLDLEDDDFVCDDCRAKEEEAQTGNEAMDQLVAMGLVEVRDAPLEAGEEVDLKKAG